MTTLNKGLSYKITQRKANAAQGAAVINDAIGALAMLAMRAIYAIHTMPTCSRCALSCSKTEGARQ
ncbi:MAG: hypothetical protein H7335_03490 [Massilia sp.]|nr:hypothetical protein [Massilia sp.]